jgi:hypothetical protein
MHTASHARWRPCRSGDEEVILLVMVTSGCGDAKEVRDGRDCDGLGRCMSGRMGRVGNGMESDVKLHGRGCFGSDLVC